MEAYTGFAEVYDKFMDCTPYAVWLDYVSKILTANGISQGLVLDLGCGTGTLTELLAETGYDMIGVDVSEDMLQIALNKRELSGNDILYLCQNMREFELYGTVRAVVSICDSVNYLLTEDEVADTFRLVNNYLDPQGIFIFDFNTVHKYRDVIGDAVIAENRDECSFIWDNHYDSTDGINEYDITFFVQEEGDRYRRFTETHYQRGYSLADMKRILKDAGMEFLSACDADNFGPVRKSSERVFITAREKGKK